MNLNPDSLIILGNKISHSYSLKQNEDGYYSISINFQREVKFTGYLNNYADIENCIIVERTINENTNPSKPTNLDTTSSIDKSSNITDDAPVVDLGFTLL
jgi:hypothetical protein